MKNSILLSLVICSFLSFSANAQQEGSNNKKNNFFLQANHHLEKRGTEKYSRSNPDFAVGYERKLVSFGDFGLLSGVRTGLYREYVLTGYGWEHPDKNRFFLGGSVSCMYDPDSRFIVQLTFLTDVLLPNDYDETWSYWAIEPSFYYLIGKNTYICLTAAMGSFIFFDPKAYMDKAGIRIGFFF